MYVINCHLKIKKILNNEKKSNFFKILPLLLD